MTRSTLRRVLHLGLLLALTAVGPCACVTVQGGDKPVQFEGNLNVNVKVQKEVDSSLSYIDSASATQPTSPGAAAAPGAADSKAQVLARLKQRVATIKQAKAAGVIGENAAGYLEIVDPTQTANISTSDLINAQNADRRQLYDLVGKETGSTPAAVTQQFAQRINDHAAKGDYFKGADGVWHQKQ
jgi:uncharacterized protein YdbL (DUF1318 family)